MNTVLLLTATVAPPKGAPDLSRTGVPDRIADYRRALRFYLRVLGEEGFQSLVMVDNSGYGVAPFEDLVADSGLSHRVELHSYAGNEVANGHNRLYGEIRLIQEALRRSPLLSGSEVFWKCTGRYIVRNIFPIIRRADVRADVHLHCRDYPVKFIDMGVFGLRTAVADRALESMAADGLGPDYNENRLRERIDNGLLAEFNVATRHACIPDFSGVRGWDSASYDGVKYRAKFLLRSMIHRVAPSVWI